MIGAIVFMLQGNLSTHIPLEIFGQKLGEELTNSHIQFPEFFLYYPTKNWLWVQIQISRRSGLLSVPRSF